MSFTPKYLTQGGQMTAYRLRMFVQVSNWIFYWMLLLFVLATGVLFWLPVEGDSDPFWAMHVWPTTKRTSCDTATTTRRIRR